MWNSSDRDHLGGLGVDQLEHVVQRKGDVHALRHAGQHVHLAHAVLHVSHHLGALDRQGSLVAQRFQEVQLARGVRLAGQALAQRHPAVQPLAPRQGDERLGREQDQARFVALEGRREVVQVGEGICAVVSVQRLDQRARDG